MRILLLARLASLLFVASATAQVLSVGVHDVSWANTSGAGTPMMSARIFYPAASDGVDVAVLPKAGGWPSIVFLHGMGLQGSDYSHLGTDYAAHGFIAVMLDTAPWIYQDLESDGRAMFAAINIANAVGSPSPLLTGAFDVSRIGIAGHSVGGGVIGLVLANNPGYRCGLALAPVHPGAAAAQVEVPFGIIVGHGDNITTWYLFSYPYYLTLAPTSGLKFLYVLDSDCDHMNVAGLAVGPAGVFDASFDVQLGFFRRFLDIDASGLEHCIGPTAMSEPRLLYFEKVMVEPQVWQVAPLVIGSTVRVSVMAAGGLSGALAALATSPGVPTLIGTLFLDPSSVFTLTQGEANREGRIDTWIDVPNIPQLIGQSFALQAAGSTPGSPLQLGSTVELFVQ